MGHIGHSGRCAASATSVGPEEKGHDSYRVAGSSMKKKKKGIALSSGDQVRSTSDGRGTRNEAAGYSSTCTPDSLGYCAVQCGTALTRQLFFPRGSPFPAGPHHASGARKRKEATTQTPCTDTDVPASFWRGRGHVTVTVIALFPTVRYHLSNLCPGEEPLSSFGFAPLSALLPMVTSRPAHQKRPCTVRPVTFCSSGGSSNLRI